jgi:membrane protein DedA with SNARE-associated domain
MVILGILIAGMVLGQRFKVLVLLPASGLAVVITIGAGIAAGETGWSIALLSAGNVFSLQIGYIAGIALRHSLIASRAARLRNSGLASPMRRPAH